MTRRDVPEALAELLDAIGDAMAQLLRLGAAGRDTAEAAALRAQLARLQDEVAAATRRSEELN